MANLRANRIRLTVAAAALGALTAGCRDPLTFAQDGQRLARSGRYVLIGDVRVPDAHSFEGCGAEALAAAFGVLDPSLDTQHECDSIPFNNRGATPIDILFCARARGWEAKLRKGRWSDLEEYVRQRRPALVMFDRAPEAAPPGAPDHEVRVMHWGLVSGVSHTGREVLLAASGGRHFVLGREQFEKRWAVAANCTVEIAPRTQSSP